MHRARDKLIARETMIGQTIIGSDNRRDARVPHKVIIKIIVLFAYPYIPISPLTLAIMYPYLVLAILFWAGVFTDDVDINIVCGIMCLYQHIDEQFVVRRDDVTLQAIILASMPSYCCTSRKQRYVMLRIAEERRCAWKIPRTAGLMDQETSEAFQRNEHFAERHFHRSYRVTKCSSLHAADNP